MCSRLPYFYSPHYLDSFCHYNFALLDVSHHRSPQFLLSVCTWEREREEVNSRTKCEHLKNRQW